MSFQPGLGEVELKGPYVALTPSPIITILENGRKILKHDGGVWNVIYNFGVVQKFPILWITGDRPGTCIASPL